MADGRHSADRLSCGLTDDGGWRHGHRTRPDAPRENGEIRPVPAAGHDEDGAAVGEEDETVGDRGDVAVDGGGRLRSGACRVRQDPDLGLDTGRKEVLLHPSAALGEGRGSLMPPR